MRSDIISDLIAHLRANSFLFSPYKTDQDKKPPYFIYNVLRQTDIIGAVGGTHTIEFIVLFEIYHTNYKEILELKDDFITAIYKFKRPIIDLICEESYENELYNQSIEVKFIL